VILVAGSWFLAAGLWLLAAGCRKIELIKQCDNKKMAFSDQLIQVKKSQRQEARGQKQKS